MKFGERVKTLRIQRGLSQEELADKIGYKDRSSVAKIENGTRDVPRPVVMKLAEALGVDAAALMRDDELNKSINVKSCDAAASNNSTDIKPYDRPGPKNIFRCIPNENILIEKFELIIHKNRDFAEDFVNNTEKFYRFWDLRIDELSYTHADQLLHMYMQLDPEKRELALSLIAVLLHSKL